jgi:hypothetical protein
MKINTSGFKLSSFFKLCQNTETEHSGTPLDRNYFRRQRNAKVHIIDTQAVSTHHLQLPYSSSKTNSTKTIKIPNQNAALRDNGFHRSQQYSIEIKTLNSNKVLSDIWTLRFSDSKEAALKFAEYLRNNPMFLSFKENRATKKASVKGKLDIHHKLPYPLFEGELPFTVLKTEKK